MSGADFPVLSANVINSSTNAPYFTPYAILPREFVDKNGNRQLVRIGVLGLLPPQIVQWDGSHLRGKVVTEDGYATAQKYVPLMKADGADVIVILAHSGIQDYPLKGGEENFSYFLTTIPDVDVVISGHAHEKFPGRAYANVKGADIENGTINGIPVVMPGSFADTLGIITISLTRNNGSWQRVSGSGQLIAVYDNAERKSNLAADPELSALIAAEHQAVLNYIRSPVGADDGGASSGGSLTAPLNSFFAVIRDDYSVQIINEAQMRYAEQALAGTAYAGLPILSAAAPFKAGGRQGPRYYTNVPTGPLAIKNIADIYVYPNTVVILKLTGANIKEWLEMSAGQFNQLHNSGQEQYIQNDDFPTYLFDVIDGVSYNIDVSRPAKYNRDGSIQDAGAERVKDLQFQGSPIKPDQEFALVTNNYRAYGGGNFPGGNPGNIIMETPDESRQVILRYIDEKREITPHPNNNWHLILPAGSGVFLFQSSPEARDALPAGISYIGMKETGFAVYQVK
jgi:2',3'-cyclic-nucleotide 2'-phosphodiesterase/3'-nucleotidase